MKSDEVEVNAGATTIVRNTSEVTQDAVADEPTRYSWRRLFRFARKKTKPAERPVNYTLLRRVLEYVKPHKKLMAMLCFFFVCNQALTLVLPVSIGYVIDNILPGKNLSKLNLIAGLLVGFLLVRCILVFFERELSVIVGSLVVRDVRAKLHGHLLRMSLQFLDNYEVGRAVARIMGDTECVRNLLLGGILNGTASFVRFIFIFGTLLWLDWRLTLISSMALPLFFVGFWRYSRRLKPAYHELSEDNAEIFSSVNETFSGIRVVKTYAGERRADANFVQRCNDFLRKTLLVTRTQHITTVMWEATSWLGLIALIWYGGQRVIGGHMSTGELVAFFGLLSQLQGPVADMISLNATLQPALASMELIDDILLRAPDNSDRPNAKQAPALKGEVHFNNVYFTYQSKQNTATSEEEDLEAEDELELAKFASLETKRRYTIEDLSFTIKPGQCLAIVGPSGSGKSTIINLLTRLYEIDAGAILVDGTDIRDYALTSYLQNFAIVQQEHFLFRGTVRENIAYSRLDATEDEIIEAAKKAGAWDFIRELDKGLDTHCGERGARLSGGQKQRISIARAILANPAILVLDEATSALDSKSEAQIQRALDILMKERTTIVIAHRLSTIVEADQILFLDTGKAIEIGTHRELLKKNGRYAEMFNEQFGRVQAATASASARMSKIVLAPKAATEVTTSAAVK